MLATQPVRSAAVLGTIVLGSALHPAAMRALPLGAGQTAASQAPAAQTPAAKAPGPQTPAPPTPAGQAAAKVGPKMWEDRGALTPARVYFGPGSAAADPVGRVPAPPYSGFEPDDKDKMATSPKATVRDAKKVKWTAKFGAEVRADTVAPRLAWALGFGAVEGYYVGPGKFEGVTAATNLGREKEVVGPDGSFPGGSRFKRHDSVWEPVKTSGGEDETWDEARNPGVPSEQLSGLLLFEVLVHNWDAQPKNCKVYRLKGAQGPEEWYIVSDLGASFADGPRHKYVLAGYQKEASYIKKVGPDGVELDFTGVIPAQAKLHRHVPLADARWFRKQLVKLTDEEIQAAFDAGYATDGLNKAYATGDAAKIKDARDHELSSEARTEISGFVTKVRAKIEEFKTKVADG